MYILGYTLVYLVKNMSAKTELNVFKCITYYGQNPFKKCWYGFKDKCRQLKWAYQRATRGYSDWDLWDLDSFYVQMFINSLREFAEKTNGYPSGITYEEWQELIRTIARCFEESQEDLETNLESWKRMQCIRQKYETLKATGNKEEAALNALLQCPEQDPEFKQAYQDWLKDVERSNKRQKEMSDRGFDLLKEWINHLWF